MSARFRNLTLARLLLLLALANVPDLGLADGAAPTGSGALVRTCPRLGSSSAGPMRSARFPKAHARADTVLAGRRIEEMRRHFGRAIGRATETPLHVALPLTMLVENADIVR